MQSVEELILHLANLGYQGRVASIQHLYEIKEEIEGRYEKGLIDREVYREYLESFDFRIPESLPKAKSIIVVAVPRPQSKALFSGNGHSQALKIPPTYVAYVETRKEVEQTLADILETKGYSVASTALPLKLLAARTGLGSYGRNNICYVPGMGSFLQLVAVYSDLPCLKDNWGKNKLMKSCENCYACRQACPTGAIPPDRFLLRAEKCIVFHNEKKGNIPFPKWIDHSWHNCLIGCFHCQRVCSQNREFLQRFEEELEFSQEETVALLDGEPYDRLPPTAVKKLESLKLSLDLIEDLNILTRNLRVFFRKKI